MNIWIIGFLVVWILANVAWNYRAYKQQKFISLSNIFQGFFAAIPNLVVMFHEWLSGFQFWTNPIFMNKELKDDIEFLKAEQKARIEAICKKIDAEIQSSGILETRKNIKKENERWNNSLRKDWEKKEPKPKNKSSRKTKEKK
jgi:TRAP-type C4-dicarboxylate transport system substrate-binding protein